MQKGVLNKQGKIGVKILWRYTDMAIFVLRCFILTHPVHYTYRQCVCRIYAEINCKHVIGAIMLCFYFDY